MNIMLQSILQLYPIQTSVWTSKNFISFQVILFKKPLTYFFIKSRY